MLRLAATILIGVMLAGLAGCMVYHPHHGGPAYDHPHGRPLPPPPPPHRGHPGPRWH